MSLETLRVDVDAATLARPGADPQQLSAMGLAVLCLYKQGHDRQSAIAWLDEEGERAVAELDRLGIDPGEVAGIEIAGHAFHPDPTPPERRTVAGALAERARLEPDALALLVEDPLDPEADAVAVTTAELSALVESVADRLAGAKLGPGSHIAVSVTPSFEAAVLFLAAWEAGVSVALVREYLADEFLDVIRRRLKPALWFMHSDPRLGLARDAWIDLSAGSDAFDAWLEAGPAEHSRPAPDPDREAAVVLTSGSTGLPKTLALAQRSLYHTARYAQLTDKPADAPLQSAATDLSAMSGLRTLVVLPALGRSPSLILAPQSRGSSLKILAAFGRHGVTHAQVIPRTLAAAAELGRERLHAMGLGAMVCAVSGTGVLHERIRARAEEALGCEVRDQFGPNESAGAFSFTQGTTLAGGGVVANDFMIRIVSEDGRTVPQGEVGSVAMFGERLFVGQYTDHGYEPRTPGWYISGDLGRRLPNGNFTVAGRNHDAIKTVEGEFLSPTMVEDVVSNHPAVREVVAIKLKSTEAGERYAIAVESASTDAALPQELTKLITSKLGAFAAPSATLIREELPRVGNQKPDRVKLAALIEEND